jgi:hypothetical protein
MDRFKSPRLMALAAAALTALGVGGAAMAQSSGQTQTAPAHQQSTDRPDGPEGKADAPDKAGEKPDAPEGKADAPDKGETGSEKPGNDGPGGHADEQGGSSQHEHQGQE